MIFPGGVGCLARLTPEPLSLFFFIAHLIDFSLCCCLFPHSSFSPVLSSLSTPVSRYRPSPSLPPYPPFVLCGPSLKAALGSFPSSRSPLLSANPTALTWLSSQIDFSLSRFHLLLFLSPYPYALYSFINPSPPFNYLALFLSVVSVLLFQHGKRFRFSLCLDVLK